MTQHPAGRPDLPLPRGLVVLVGMAALTVVVAGVRSLGEILGPVFVALILTIAVSPLVSWLRRRGAPAWLATLAGVLAAYLVLAILAASLGFAIAELAARLPAYSDQFNSLIDQVSSLLARLGVGQVQVEDALSQLDVGSVVTVLQNVLSQVAGIASDLLLIVLVVLFMGMDAVNFRGRLAAIAGERGDVVTALTSFAGGTRRFLWVTSVFGLATAVLDTIALLVLGVPLALVWGLLAFITNYIPNIGFLLGLVPPALLALPESGPATAVGISVTLSVVALVFWAMTKALLIDVDPNNHWINVLITARPPKAATKAKKRDQSAVDG